MNALTPFFLQVTISYGQDSDSSFLNDEWQATAIALCITLFIFVLGLPALFFQTFIKDGLRLVYNERLDKKDWKRFYIVIAVIFIVFLSSSQMVNKWVNENNWDPLLFSAMVIAVILVFFYCGIYMKERFSNTKDIEGNLSKKIIDDALINLKSNKSIQKDIEDLSVLAKELPSGLKKTAYLNECERLVEYLLDYGTSENKIEYLERILHEAVCISILYDEAQFNNENTKRVMEILELTYYKAYSNNLENDPDPSYQLTKIANCMHDIGAKAMRNNDLDGVMDVIEKLSMIDATEKELFNLGSLALQERHPHTGTVVAIIKKLESKIRPNLAPAQWKNNTTRRPFYFWFGLMANLHRLGGSTGEYALTQYSNLFPKRTSIPKDDLERLFKESEKHFLRRADFVTIDAMRAMRSAIR